MGNHQLKVLLISGSFPPIKCGVGEYVYYLVKNLACNPAVKVGILSSAGYDKSVAKELDNVSLINNPFGWRVRDTLRILKIIANFAPDIVHVQYPTTEYKGLLARYLPLLLKLRGITVVQTWHEHYTTCGTIGWQNILAVDAFVYVRPDFFDLLPRWVKWWLRKTPRAYVPNASTIPIPILDALTATQIKHSFSASRAIVSFFGFANENKGIETIFEIANPEKHHIVLICDLNPTHPYHQKILDLSNSSRWAGKVTITGFLPEVEVGKILSISDAIIFPFPHGTGVWNTSLKAAESTGTFILATTKDNALLGYNMTNNIYFCACEEITEMSAVLESYLGRRIQPQKQHGWHDISHQHLALYYKLNKQP